MYKRFYKLAADPFTTNPDQRFLYMMPHVREALACLEYGITNRKGFMVLTGEVGTGKTTILRRMLHSLPEQTRVFSSFIFNPGLELVEFMELMLHDFGIPVSSRTKSGMLIELNRWLVDRYRAGDRCVLVVDEAQNLVPEMLEEIRLLTNLETSSEKLLQIVLSGQPELESKLRDPRMRQLRQRISLWSRTKPLTLEQTHEYVSTRLRIAGTTEKIFEPETVKVIHQISRGIPRVINLICEHCLIFGYVEQRSVIPPSLAWKVIKDFGLDDVAGLDAPILPSDPAKSEEVLDGAHKAEHEGNQA